MLHSFQSQKIDRIKVLKLQKKSNKLYANLKGKQSLKGH